MKAEDTISNVRWQATIDLAGEWQFALDREDVGIAQEWYARELPDRIALPGSLQAQSLGDDVTAATEWVGSVFDDEFFVGERFAPYRQPGNVKVPFWLQPIKRYMGAAWYRKEFWVSAEWSGKYCQLMLERPHWSTRVWIDGRDLGDNVTLSVPHNYALGTLTPGLHTLTICVDNRMLYNVGPNAHSVSDHTQTAWNGIVGRMEVTVHDAIQITQMQVTPDVAKRAFTIDLLVRNWAHASGVETGRDTLSGRLVLAVALTNVDGTHMPSSEVLDVELKGAETSISVIYELDDQAHTWDEFHPALYRITADLQGEAGGNTYNCQVSVTAGLRQIRNEGRQILLNERPIFLRGTLECCIFPHTGYSPTDIDSWRRILRICKAHGLNHMRFHSWCPPEAAFQAGDEEGVYFQVECAVWVNMGPGVGLGDPVDAWIYAEAQRILDAYGHHACFVMMAHGNEPGGNQVEYLRKWVAYWRQRDRMRLFTSGAGWPEIPENHYHNLPDARIQQSGDQLLSRINALPPETMTDYRARVQRSEAPIVSHEVGQWCVYPNFEEIAKYDGYLRAHNFEVFRDFLNANHMGDQAHDFFMASGKLQALCYKEEIEALLRTPDLGGFQLLDLHDFPGQGTALVGVLDAFWDAKPYINAEEFRNFCGAVVPLARLPKRYWRVTEQFVANVQVAHWGDSSIDAEIVWRIADATGAIVAEGTLPRITLDAGGLRDSGTISALLDGLATAQKYSLQVEIAGLGVANDWYFWLFADVLTDELPDATQTFIHITSELNGEALSRLHQGGKVLLTLPPESVRAPSQIGFSSVFWNTSWTRAQGISEEWPQGQAPHTLGILCNPAHPIFADFPTEYHSNWQWWELIHGSAAMVLDALPATVRPLVQPIDTWFEARRLGLLLEAEVEGGHLIVCSMDITNNLEARLVARQMRHTILRYMASEAFRPAHKVDVGLIRNLAQAQ